MSTQGNEPKRAQTPPTHSKTLTHISARIQVLLLKGTIKDNISSKPLSMASKLMGVISASSLAAT